MSSNDTAMLFAAGLGTRLKPFTDNHPKALAAVNGKTLLQRNIEYLQSFGFTKVVVNVHHFADQIKDAINNNNGWGSHISISDETDAVLETGGGLKKAIPLFGNAENIVVMNVDILTNLNLTEMLQHHIQENSLTTLAVTDRATSRYFVFNNNRLCGWMNTQTGETKGFGHFDETIHTKKAFSGVQIINRELFLLMKQEGKFSMVDVYLSLMNQHKIIAYNHSHTKFIDVGKPESIAKAEALFEW